VGGVKCLSRMLSPAGFEKLQRLLYRGENVDGIRHRHWKTGEIMAGATSPHTPRHMQEGRTGRIALLNLMKSEIPEGTVKYGKQGVRVENLGAAGMRVYFADGSSEDADLVVAADGLYSKIRKQYIPDNNITYKGRVSYSYNIPIGMVQHIEGLPTHSSSWQGNNDVVFLSRLQPGVYTFVTNTTETEDFADSLRWAHDVGQTGVERLRKRFTGWDSVLDQVLQLLPDISAYPLQVAPWMGSLICEDALAFVGDAAHPTGGAYGSGCSFAFADVRALYLSLQRTYNSKPNVDSFKPLYNVSYALHLYNETRMPFLKRVESQLGNDKLDAAYVAAACDEEEWIRRWKKKFTINWWILEHDVDAKWQEVEAQERHVWHRKNKEDGDMTDVFGY